MSRFTQLARGRAAFQALVLNQNLGIVLNNDDDDDRQNFLSSY